MGYGGAKNGVPHRIILGFNLGITWTYRLQNTIKATPFKLDRTLRQTGRKRPICITLRLTYIEILYTCNQLNLLLFCLLLLSLKEF